MTIDWEDNTKRKVFRKALQEVYPSGAALAIFVDEELGENLEVVAGGTNLQSTAHELVKWARTQGKLDEVYQAFKRQNPKHSVIGQLEQEAFVPQPWDLSQQARDLIYTSLIDSAVEYCHLSEWKHWTFGPLEPIPIWTYNLPQDFHTFRQKVFSTDFPGTLTELERAVKTLSILLHKAAKVFQENCQIKEDLNGNLYYVGVQFYKIPEWDTEKHSKLLQEFNEWVEACHQLVIDATRAANWFREVVRRDINPMFFAADGKFVATYPWSGDVDLSHQYLLPEYTQDEKDSLPDSLPEDE